MKAKNGWWDEKVTNILFWDKKKKWQMRIGNLSRYICSSENKQRYRCSCMYRCSAKSAEKRVKCGRKSNLVSNEILGPFLSSKSLKWIYSVKTPYIYMGWHAIVLAEFLFFFWEKSQRRKTAGGCMTTCDGTLISGAFSHVWACYVLSIVYCGWILWTGQGKRKPYISTCFCPFCTR